MKNIVESNTNIITNPIAAIFIPRAIPFFIDISFHLESTMMGVVYNAGSFCKEKTELSFSIKIDVCFLLFCKKNRLSAPYFNNPGFLYFT